MKVKFDSPVEINGVKVDNVEIREPKVKDMIEMQKRTGTDAEKELFLLADLTQVSPDDLKEMTFKTYKKLHDALTENFLS